MNLYFALAAFEIKPWLLGGGTVLLVLLAILAFFLVIKYGSLWFQAYMSSADVSMVSLIGMSLRRVNATEIVKAQVMAAQAGLTIADGRNTTSSLEAHYLAGGDINRVIVAIISANRAGIDLDLNEPPPSIWQVVI